MEIEVHQETKDLLVNVAQMVCLEHMADRCIRNSLPLVT